MTHRSPTAPLWLLACVLTGCSGGQTVSGRTDSVVSLPQWEGIHHPFLPTPLGAIWGYQGTSDGLPMSEEVQALEEWVTVGGVACVAVVSNRYVDGRLVEHTTEWFAEGLDGSVWAMGQEATEWNGTRFVRNEQSWQAGREGAKGVLFLPAVPQVGQHFLRELPYQVEKMFVASTTARAPAASGISVVDSADCLELVEMGEDGEEDEIVLYARDVGRVRKTDGHGESTIVLYRRPR